MRPGRALGVWLLIAGCGGRSYGGELGSGCDTDLDCKGNRVCVNYQCADPGPGSSGTGQAGGSAGTSGAGSPSGGSANTSRGGQGGSSAGSSGGTTPTAGRGGSAGAAGEDAVGASPVRVDIDASALIADPTRERLYAVVTGGATMYANELVVIDPVDATVEASVVVGSDPDSLAISSDATKLWVGLHGALSLREVDLTAWPPEPGAQYALPAASFPRDAVHAGPMVVLPEEPESVAVSLHYDGLSPSFAGVVVIDAGTPRPNGTPSHTGASRLTGGPPGHLFGFNNLHTGFGFYSLTVDATGAGQLEHEGLFDGFGTDIIYHAGYVFGTNGQVVDVSSPDEPVRIGQFSFSGLIVPQAAAANAVMLSSLPGGSPSSSGAGTNLLVLRRLNLETFRQDVEVPIDGRFGTPHHLVEPRPGLFAFVDSPGRSSASTTVGPSLVYLVSAPELQ